MNRKYFYLVQHFVVSNEHQSCIMCPSLYKKETIIIMMKHMHTNLVKVSKIKRFVIALDTSPTYCACFYSNYYWMI